MNRIHSIISNEQTAIDTAPPDTLSTRIILQSKPLPADIAQRYAKIYARAEQLYREAQREGREPRNEGEADGR
jgi:DNA-binding PucR family transcriptional regulator